MSIWHIEEYKPRAPRAQPQLQSAYTWDKERSLPDLEGGFRIQSSDQAWVPAPSYLYVENGVRLGMYDPHSWGPEYESFLQTRIDQNDGYLAPLDAPSQRDQSVNHDGFPLNQPPQLPQAVPGQVGGPGEELGRKRRGRYAEQARGEEIAKQKSVPFEDGPPKGYFPKDVSFEQLEGKFQEDRQTQRMEELQGQSMTGEDEKESIKEEEKSIKQEEQKFESPQLDVKSEKKFMDVLTPMRIQAAEQKQRSVSPALSIPSVIPLGYETPAYNQNLRRTTLLSSANQQSNLRSTSSGSTSFQSSAFPVYEPLKRRAGSAPLSGQPKMKTQVIQETPVKMRSSAEEKKEEIQITPQMIRKNVLPPTPSTEDIKEMNFKKVRDVANKRHGVTARSKAELISRLKGKLTASEWEKFKQEFKGKLE